MEPFDPDAHLETEYERVMNYVLDQFETGDNGDGSFLPIDFLMPHLGEMLGMSRTEVRDWVDWLSGIEGTLLVVDRELGMKVVRYRPFKRYKMRLRKCHEEADENGNVSPTLIKLLLQEYVVLDQPQRDVVLQELLDDEKRSVRMTTLRRAHIDRVLHDSLVTFRVAPERY